MKKLVLSSIAGLAFTIANMAEALDISPTTNSISPTTVSNWIYPSQILLPIVIDTAKKDNKLEARLTKLQDAGVNLGLEKMIIDGEATATESDDGGKDYAISWAGASLRKDDGTKVSTYIGKPLQSTVSANPALKGGDSFTAEGDPNELLEAWKRLQAMLEKDDKKEKASEEKKSETPMPTRDFGSNNTQPQQPQNIPQSPNFAVKAQPVIISTSDGCHINVDLVQMVAIVRERTLQDGKEVSGCQDTLTRYPLDKKYSICAAKVDSDAGKVYQQYTLSYSDPNSGGAVQVADCQPDTDKSIPISTDSASCGLRHDFTKGLSYLRAKKTYVDPQGNIQTVQDCEDTEVTYPHESTYEGCEDIIDLPGMKAVHQKRIRITKDGQIQYLTQCAPDTADYAELRTEACTGANRYTHDFGGGQSFLNQTIYYTDTGNNRKDVQTCQPGTITFQHKKDETVCTATNDDSTRQTTLYAKTYIEEEAGKPIFLSDCQATTPAIPYIKTSDLWKVQNTVKKEFEPTAQDIQDMNQLAGFQESITSDGITTCGGAGTTTGFTYTNVSSPYPYKGMPWSFNHLVNYYTRGSTVPTYNRCTPSSSTASLSGMSMCVAGPDRSNWKTTDGITVDTKNSTVSPTTLTNVALQNMTETSSGGRIMLVQSGSTPRSATFTCPKASCDMTTLFANPVYLRGDNSSYTDFGTVTGTKYVCGDGSNLQGKGM